MQIHRMRTVSESVNELKALDENVPLQPIALEISVKRGRYGAFFPEKRYW